MPVELDFRTKGLISGRVPKLLTEYDLDYFLGKKRAEGVPYPENGAYVDPNSEYRFKFQALVGWVNKYIGEGLILDIGSGPGHFAYWSEKQLMPYKVVSLDISETILASEYNQNRRASIIGGGANLPIASDKFQGVLLSDVLEHEWPNKALEMIKESYRVLDRGGYIFINIPNRRSFGDAARKDEHHVWLPSTQEVKDLIRLGGFSKGPFEIFTRGFPFSFIYERFSKSDLRLPVLGNHIRAVAKK